MHSETCQIYGITTVPLGALGRSETGSGLEETCQIFLANSMGYPFLLKAPLMCLFSASLSVIDVQILSAIMRRVLLITILCAKGWWQP